jgi:hypothetical protein
MNIRLFLVPRKFRKFRKFDPGTDARAAAEDRRS